MSNPVVNVILFTSKLNWGYGRLTLFTSSAGTSRPTLLKELCILSYGQERCMCVYACSYGLQVRKIKKIKLVIKQSSRGIVGRVKCSWLTIDLAAHMFFTVTFIYKHISSKGEFLQCILYMVICPQTHCIRELFCQISNLKVNSVPSCIKKVIV